MTTNIYRYVIADSRAIFGYDTSIKFSFSVLVVVNCTLWLRDEIGNSKLATRLGHSAGFYV